MIRRHKKPTVLGILVFAALVVTAIVGSGVASANKAAKKYKVFVALSYSGNSWQDEASNLALAIAKTPPYNSMVDVTKEISGLQVQAQISQYQSMIAAGANAIVSFPVSPTALNATIRQGCARGVIFVMYDATVTEPCAYNVSYITAPPLPGGGRPTHPFMGYNSAEWLAKALHGKGNIFVVRGVPGNSVDATHYASAMGAFKNYPDIHVIDTYYGYWDSATQLKETSKALAAHPNVQGIWAGYGESGTIKALIAKHMRIPVTGETSNYFRWQLTQGWPGVSSGSPPASGGIAMKVAMLLLTKGKNAAPHDIEIPLDWVTSQTVKVCPGNTYTAGCNVFPRGKVPDEATAEIFQPQMLPESSLSASETGNPTPGMNIKPLPNLFNAPFVQPPSRRYVTRGYCDKGWKPGMLPEGVMGCVKG